MIIKVVIPAKPKHFCRDNDFRCTEKNNWGCRDLQSEYWISKPSFPQEQNWMVSTLSILKPLKTARHFEDTPASSNPSIRRVQSLILREVTSFSWALYPPKTLVNIFICWNGARTECVLKFRSIWEIRRSRKKNRGFFNPSETHWIFGHL